MIDTSKLTSGTLLQYGTSLFRVSRALEHGFDLELMIPAPERTTVMYVSTSVIRDMTEPDDKIMQEYASTYTNPYTR